MAKLTNKQKLQQRLENAERARQQRVAAAHKKGDEVRSKSATYKGKSTNSTLSKNQIESWATEATGISPTQGKNTDRKAGRTKGRFIKGKL